MKNHLKRIASPKSWILDRKNIKYTIRPKAGAHKLNNGIALGIILRDILKVSSTLSETRKLLTKNEVLVDGKRRTEYRHIVGLFDVVTLTETKQAYRITLDYKGRIILINIPFAEHGLKVCKVVGKSILPENKVQLNLHDGKNILTKEKVSVGESVLLSLPSLEIKEVLHLKPGATIFLTKGKHVGDVGSFVEIKGREVFYQKDGQEIKTAKDYLFIVGKDKSLITLSK